MSKIKLILICFFFSSIYINANIDFANMPSKTITYTDLFKTLTNSTDSEIVISNVEIIFDAKTDDIRYHKTFIGFGRDPEVNYTRTLEEIKIKSKVKLQNVKTKKMLFRKVYFLNGIEIENCTADSIILFGCTINNGSKFVNNTISFNVLNIVNCNLVGTNIFSINNTRLSLANSTINADKNPTCTPVKVNTSGANNTVLFFHDKIRKTSDKNYIDLMFCNLDRLFFQNDTIEPIVFLHNSSINKFLYIGHTVFENPISCTNADIPFYNTDAKWEQLAGKLAVIPDIKKWAPHDTYQGKREDGFDKGYSFSWLMKAYAKFYNIYRFNNDGESANACYIEMKNIETLKAEVEYKTTPSLENLFSWKLNLLLRDSCSYTTNPIQALLYGLNVIFIFAFIYFFLPTEKDGLSTEKFSSFYSNLILYLTSDKKLHQFYEEKNNDEVETYRKLGKQLQKSRKEIPSLLNYFFKLYHTMLLANKNILPFILRKIDFAKEKWITYSVFRKWLLSILLFLSLCIYFIFSIVLRLFNATMLSLNAYITLGYGELSASGIARYFYVVEGVIGWFLLAVFGVCLVNQF